MSTTKHTIEAGSVLISAPDLEDAYFEKVVIYITEYNEQGALGFVINQLHDRNFNELTEFRNSQPFPLHEGGPVEEDKLYFIHRLPDTIIEGSFVADGVYFGGNFKQAVQYINSHIDATNNIRLFIGYSGWEARQLEAEIEEGSWLPVPVSAAAIFQLAEATLWEELYRRSRL